MAGKVAEAPMLGRKVLHESARAEVDSETDRQLPVRRKALQSETHECWKLKEISKGIGSENRQMGSQTQKADFSEDMAKSSGRFDKGE